MDGLYGPRTQRAVTGFERSRGLPADGVAGLDTLRALALIAGAPRHLTPNQTSRPRPAAPAVPRAVHAHRTRRVPVLPLIAGLALLGLLTLWTSYLRALARIRRARAEVPWIDQARLGSGNGDGLGGSMKKNARVRRLPRAQGGTMTTDLTTIGSHLRTGLIGLPGWQYGGATARRRLRVLIADADPFARRAIRDALQAAEGIAVVADASDDREALELSRWFRPDVLLVDMGLPGSGGVDVARDIKRDVPETQVAMLSAPYDEEATLVALRAGAVGT